MPQRHRRLRHGLNLAAFLGVPFVVWGLVALDRWPIVMAPVLIIGGKRWYTDRMALLDEDMVGERHDRR
ncbi:hypothetical protein M1105_19945 [Limibaculum sp. FT325]|nr:hypothetical protein [Limibaculum sediminis]